MHAQLEYSLLGATETAAHAESAVRAIAEAGFTHILVTPPLLGAVVVAGQDRLQIASVCGFPSGKHHPLIKATEARFAVQNGATEIVVVPDLGSIESRDSNALLSELITIREAITDQVLMSVVLEAPLFDAAQLQVALATCAQSGATSVTASTSPGMTAHGVRKLAEQLADATPQLGLRVLNTEEDPGLYEAGATRLTVPSPPRQV